MGNDNGNCGSCSCSCDCGTTNNIPAVTGIPIGLIPLSGANGKSLNFLLGSDGNDVSSSALLIGVAQFLKENNIHGYDVVWRQGKPYNGLMPPTPQNACALVDLTSPHLDVYQWDPNSQKWSDSPVTTIRGWSIKDVQVQPPSPAPAPGVTSTYQIKTTLDNPDGTSFFSGSISVYNGKNGADGEDGEGSVIVTGDVNAPPSGDSYPDGSLYICTQSPLNFWQKENSSWTQKGHLQGDAGANGNNAPQIAFNDTAPPPAEWLTNGNFGEGDVCFCGTQTPFAIYEIAGAPDGDSLVWQEKIDSSLDPARNYVLTSPNGWGVSYPSAATDGKFHEVDLFADKSAFNKDLTGGGGIRLANRKKQWSNGDTEQSNPLITDIELYLAGAKAYLNGIPLGSGGGEKPFPFEEWDGKSDIPYDQTLYYRGGTVSGKATISGRLFLLGDTEISGEISGAKGSFIQNFCALKLSGGGNLSINGVLQNSGIINAANGSALTVELSGVLLNDVDLELNDSAQIVIIGRLSSSGVINSYGTSKLTGRQYSIIELKGVCSINYASTFDLGSITTISATVNVAENCTLIFDAGSSSCITEMGSIQHNGIMTLAGAFLENKGVINIWAGRIWTLQSNSDFSNSGSVTIGSKSHVESNGQWTQSGSLINSSDGELVFDADAQVELLPGSVFINPSISGAINQATIQSWIGYPQNIINQKSGKIVYVPPQSISDGWRLPVIKDGETQTFNVPSMSEVKSVSFTDTGSGIFRFWIVKIEGNAVSYQAESASHNNTDTASPYFIATGVPISVTSFARQNAKKALLEDLTTQGV